MADWPEPPEERPTPSGGALAERVSDADRDRTVTLLREHVVVGRLTLDEFSERVGLALEARTRGDLDAVMANLPALSVPYEDSGPRSSRRWHVAIMSGSDTKGRWRMGAKTTAVAIMGGCDMDLRRAEIEAPEVLITAVAFWGGIKIIVPEGFDVDMRGFSFMGGRSVKTRDVPRVPGSPRIVVRGFAVMGGVDVRSRPNRSGRKMARAVVDGVQGVVDALPSRSGDEWAPIDLATLSQDIRRQIKGQRSPGRSRNARAGTGAGAGAGAGADAGADRPFPSVPAAPVPAASAAATPMPTDGTVTILFSDMVDYAGMTERLGDQLSRQLLYEHHRIVRTHLERHGGREVKVQGDGFMVAFGGVARALRCSIEIQRAFESYSEDHPHQPIQVHMGVHTGDAWEEDDDFLGHTVIVASRLASVAGPGEILVSSLSEQLVQGTGEFTFTEHRDATLKGMTRPQQSATLAWAG
jgi:class 3 adenylate cyclase